jgi:hypothetical protein
MREQLRQPRNVDRNSAGFVQRHLLRGLCLRGRKCTPLRSCSHRAPCTNLVYAPGRRETAAGERLVAPAIPGAPTRPAKAFDAISRHNPARSVHIRFRLGSRTSVALFSHCTACKQQSNALTIGVSPIMLLASTANTMLEVPRVSLACRIAWQSPAWCASREGRPCAALFAVSHRLGSANASRL